MIYHSRKILLRNALDLAGSHGVSASLILAFCGLDEQSAWRETGLVPTHRLAQALERAASLSRRNDFGLKWGERADYRSFGAIGLAIKQEKTIGRAMAKTGHYLRQLNIGHHFTMRRSGGNAALHVHFPAAEHVQGRHYCEGSMLVIVRFARFLSADQWTPRLVRFTHARLAGPYAYEKAFGCPVLFDQEESLVESDAAALARRLVFEDSPIGLMTQKVIEDMQGDKGLSLPARVAGIVPQLLPAGKATTAHIADLLNMSPRTLQRRLADHDTSLKQIVNGLRNAIVRRQVELGNASGRNLASALGYSEASAASRFIRNRLGVTKTDLVETALKAGLGTTGTDRLGLSSP